ncbi:MAG: capsule biosynthesis protein [Hyphomicrobiales bacterium]|nr:MAG: capsule biosynthesis protein [Hyphomicrobiales bacterium]
MFRKISSFAILVAALTGCAALPGEGPSAIDIKAEDIQNLPTKDYVVVDIDAKVANIAGQHRARDFAEHFSIKSTGRGQLVGVGDALVVNIWEAGENGLFSTAQAKQTSVETIVDETGRIFIPYAGRVRASGIHVETLRQNIENALLDKAVQPQVQVLIKGNQSNSAVIVGDVNNPGRRAISIAGTRVLDFIAQAGGSKFPTYETMVTMKRGNRTAAVLLESLFDFPENNVYLRAEDNLLLSHMPRSFTIFGAVSETKAVKFESRTVTMAEALAKAGGLNDNRADPGGVFLFRFEDLEVARQLNPKVDELGQSGYRVPVVYRLNFREPKAFFIARYFELRDKDVLYVANHPTAELGKFLRIIGPGVSAARGINIIAND